MKVSPRNARKVFAAHGAQVDQRRPFVEAVFDAIERFLHAKVAALRTSRDAPEPFEAPTGGLALVLSKATDPHLELQVWSPPSKPLKPSLKPPNFKTRSCMARSTVMLQRRALFVAHLSNKSGTTCAVCQGYSVLAGGVT